MKKDVLISLYIQRLMLDKGRNGFSNPMPIYTMNEFNHINNIGNVDRRAYCEYILIVFSTTGNVPTV